MALIHSISITDFFFTNSGTVFPSVLINFSQCEPFSARQKGRNRRCLSRERSLVNQVAVRAAGNLRQRWSAPRLLASDMYDIVPPIRFGFGASMYRIKDRIRAWSSRSLGLLFSPPLYRGMCMHTFLHELRLGILTLALVGNRAKRLFPQPFYSACYFVLKSSGKENREIANSCHWKFTNV